MPIGLTLAKYINYYKPISIYLKRLYIIVILIYLVGYWPTPYIVLFIIKNLTLVILKFFSF